MRLDLAFFQREFARDPITVRTVRHIERASQKRGWIAWERIIVALRPSKRELKKEATR